METLCSDAEIRVPRTFVSSLAKAAQCHKKPADGCRPALPSPGLSACLPNWIKGRDQVHWVFACTITSSEPDPALSNSRTTLLKTLHAQCPALHVQRLIPPVQSRAMAKKPVHPCELSANPSAYGWQEQSHKGSNSTDYLEG